MGIRHTVAVAAAACALLAPADALAKTYGGRTEQDRRIYLRISDDGQTLNRLEIGWRAKCEVRTKFSGRTFSTDEPLERDGDLFRMRARYSHRVGASHTGITSVRLAGYDRDTRAYGSWRATTSIRRSGREVDRCTTGGLVWRAPRSG